MDLSKPKSLSPPPPDPTSATSTVPTQKKPGPKPWVTPKLWAFLETGIPDYQGMQAVKGKVSAIDNFLNDFMLKFWAVHPITGDRTAVGDRMWYQNHRNKKTETAVCVADIFPKARTHALKAEEVYSQLYYKDRVKPLVDEQKAGVSSRSEVLRIIKDTTKELFAIESLEVRTEVSAQMKEQAEAQVVMLTVENSDDTTPEMYAVVLGDAAGQIKAFNVALSKATGWSMLTIVGGPDPWENGKITMYGLYTLTYMFMTVPEVHLARALKRDVNTPGSSSQDHVGSPRKPSPDAEEDGNRELDEEVVTGAGTNTKSTEGHEAVSGAVDNIDIEGDALEAQQAINPAPPSSHVPEDPVNDDTLSSEEQSSANVSSQNPVHGMINLIVEHPREAKSAKHQRSRAQVDESLVITRPKRVCRTCAKGDSDAGRVGGARRRSSSSLCTKSS
ncbi:hypothetical protein ARMGADRAFT_1036841 [Armillaria gallica]|uniref:Uncharacterized protein n=1 Tax=Armillaria gallica TaxID=47427 RepID=A0A2H3D767_ARMGA|nr:hypothetical protein ARMGADRAFT_1036841 [Armillaria gallica]